MNGAKAVITTIRDGLENLVTGLGVNGLDKRKGTRFTRGTVRDEELLDMYRTDWAAAKVVDIVPQDCLRAWRSVSFDGNDDQRFVEAFYAEERRIGLAGKLMVAHKWARLYGGSIVVLSVDNSGQPDTPLDITRPGIRLSHINVFDKTKITPSPKIIEDPMSPSWGLPEYYTVNGSTQRIHHSRALRVNGVELPYNELRRRNYWHDSVLQKLYDSLLNFNIVAEHAAGLVFESNVDIFKVPNLMSRLASPSGEEEIRKRFSLAKRMKSSHKILLMDSEEDHEIKKQSFSDLADLLYRYLGIVSAGPDIPATRFLGTSANGLNATGEGDLKNYYDMLSSEQARVYSDALGVIDKLISVNIGADQESVRTKWNNLHQPTATEAAGIENARADRDAKYYDMGVIDSLSIARELKEAGTYSNIDSSIEVLEGRSISEFEDDLEKVL